MTMHQTMMKYDENDQLEMRKTTDVDKRFHLKRDEEVIYREVLFKTSDMRVKK
jgi:hypothetical protein